MAQLKRNQSYLKLYTHECIYASEDENDLSCQIVTTYMANHVVRYF